MDDYRNWFDGNNYGTGTDFGSRFGLGYGFGYGHGFGNGSGNNNRNGHGWGLGTVGFRDGDGSGMPFQWLRCKDV